MTTVAANLDTIAADSNVSVAMGDFRVTTKIFPIKGGFVGYSGEVQAAMKIVEWLQNPRRKKPEFYEDDQAELLILDKDGLAYVDTNLVVIRLRESFYAVGTGAQAARAAMILGHKPKMAVEIACRIDPYSKPPINVVKIKLK